jgi:branched-chain amino acid aminotransferase
MMKDAIERRQFHYKAYNQLQDNTTFMSSCTEKRHECRSTLEHGMIQAWRITTKQMEHITFSDHSSLDAITRQLPDGFYSTFRTYGQGTRVIGLKAHLQRLYQPVKWPKVSELTLREQLALLLKKYPHEARARVLMTKEGQLYVAIEPLKPLPREVYENGVRVKTIEMSRESPRLKSTAFISASQDERKHIARAGIFEALMVKNGRILEGMTSNFFYIIRPERTLSEAKGQSKGGPQESVRFDYDLDKRSVSAQREVLCTAQRDVLLGVTRRTVIRVARGCGLEVRYQPLKRDQIEVAREAFLTSSSRGIVPVVQIDEVTVGEGRRRAEPVEAVGTWTKTLSLAYQAYVEERSEAILV